MDSALQVAPGTVIGDDYRIQRPLSQGGMGAVYVAEQVSTGKLRALKLMHPQLVTDPKSRVRFIDEARVGAKIPSEHVVEVVGAGVDSASGVPYLAMELLEGEDLSSVVERSGALPPASVRELMLQLGHALGAAHTRGIVHRDLKPENVFIARSRRRGAELMVKVLDFGIAKTLESNRTAATATSAMGSPLFMAPEQATPGAPIRPETDVWALGLIAFHALTGRYYWRSAEIEPFNLQSLLAEVLVHPLPPASARAAELGLTGTLPPGFDAWFVRCVARDPAGRFGDAGACVESFEALMQGNLHDAGAAGSPSSSTGPAAFAATMHATPAPSGSAPSYGSGPGGFGSTPAHGSFGAPPGPGSSPGAFASSPAPVARTAYMMPGGTMQAQVAPPSRSVAPILIGLVGCGGGIAVVSVALLVLFAKPTPAPAPPASPASRREVTTPPEAPLAPIAPRAPSGEPPAWEPPAGVPTGSVRVNTRPWSTVYLNGRLVGRTPLTVVAPEGQHSLRMVTDQGADETVTVSVQVGETTTLVRQLEPGPSPEPLPPSPNRSDVVAAMQSVSPAVAACARDHHGIAAVRVSFRGPAGDVSNATVGGGSFSEEERSCISAAVRQARVPPFSRPIFSVNYPFRL
ncbi:MAG: protein kinase [Sandaracinaceae bacterium]|nr:protein kinase [Sandaracinaceae bacterium]